MQVSFQAPALTLKYYNRLVRLARDKYSSLICLLVSAAEKKFCNIDNLNQCIEHFTTVNYVFSS
jgi:hypothetical protein